MLEVLAGVPTIVYGYFALETVTPFLQKIFPDMGIFNALSAGLVVGIMVLPMISSLSEDAMRAVPKTLRHGAYALGATRFEVALKIVRLPLYRGCIILRTGILARDWRDDDRYGGRGATPR